MKKQWDAAGLIGFETRIANEFNKGNIKAPIHLSDGNEVQLIEIFKNVQESDWIFCTWRSHLQCLLKGVPEEKVYQEIMIGNSITLAFPEYRVFSSAIVGGILPIAVGAAIAEKKMKSETHVWCFIGDMTSETGIAQTVIAYANNHKLPITFIIEDNGISTITDTREVWGTSKLRYELRNETNVIFYKYKSKYPHSGAGVRVQF